MGRLAVGPASGWTKKNGTASFVMFEDRVAVALMAATGLRVQRGVNPPAGVLPEPGVDALVRGPWLQEGGAYARPDFVLFRGGVIEVFEATLNAELLDQKRTFGQKLQQIAVAVPALARLRPGRPIVYSIVTIRALDPQVRDRLVAELTIPGRTEIPVQLVWRVAS